MAEFEVFLTRFTNMNEIYSGLYNDLLNKEKTCFKELEKAPLSMRKTLALKCERDRLEYEKFYENHKKMFVEKGKMICQKAMDENIDSKNDCLKVYHNNVLLLGDVLVRKLDFLVNDLSINNL